MGRRLAAGLTALGQKVRIISLPGDSLGEKARKEGADVFFGDITRKGDVQAAFADVDCVYHLAAIILSPHKKALFGAVNYQGTRNMVELSSEHGVEQFIYVSSASVAYTSSNHYSRSKKMAEDFVRASSIKCKVVARPTLAYERGGAQEFMYFAHYLKKFPVIPFIGPGTALKRPVYVQDIIHALTAMLHNDKCCDKVYDLAGSETLTIKQVAHQILSHMGTPKPFIHLPVWFCRILAAAAEFGAQRTGRQPLLTWQTITGMTQDANPDITPACKDLGYNPIGFTEGLKLVGEL